MHLSLAEQQRTRLPMRDRRVFRAVLAQVSYDALEDLGLSFDPADLDEMVAGYQGEGGIGMAQKSS